MQLGPSCLLLPSWQEATRLAAENVELSRQTALPSLVALGRFRDQGEHGPSRPDMIACPRRLLLARKGFLSTVTHAQQFLRTGELHKREMDETISPYG